jgi:hypothetical protein
MRYSKQMIRAHLKKLGITSWDPRPLPKARRERKLPGLAAQFERQVQHRTQASIFGRTGRYCCHDAPPLKGFFEGA